VSLRLRPARRNGTAKAGLASLLLALALAAEATAQTRELVVRIPGPGGTSMVATVMRPSGEDRKPVAVINHGSPADGSQRARMAPPRYNALSSWFVSRGYVVVLPLRRGYGETGGSWAESYGSCQLPDYYNAGLQGAADIRAALDYVRGLPYVSAERSLVIGESAGGWATLALSSRNPPGVSGMIDFAGGRGGHQKLPGGGTGNCAPEALVTAAGRYGATARVPILWVYAANDSFFEPSLARRMFDSYVAAGGRGTYLPLGSFGKDGHRLAASDSGVAVWQGPVSEFLAGLR
jgi:dienelactone hydrolase